MAEYIDREIVSERLERVFKLQAQTAKKLVDDIPTADVKPVIHGEWLTTRQDAPMFGFYYCSLCGRKRTSPQDNFCPNCGADMRT